MNEIMSRNTQELSQTRQLAYSKIKKTMREQKSAYEKQVSSDVFRFVKCFASRALRVCCNDPASHNLKTPHSRCVIRAPGRGALWTNGLTTATESCPWRSQARQRLSCDPAARRPKHLRKTARKLSWSNLVDPGKLLWQDIVCPRLKRSSSQHYFSYATTIYSTNSNLPRETNNSPLSKHDTPDAAKRTPSVCSARLKR